MIVCIAFVVVLLAAYLFAIMPGRPAHEAVEPFEQTYVAHRGLFDNAGDAPENSMRAFQQAIDAGYAIELDVQLTADGTVVVTHDKSQLRVAGVDMLITEMTEEEVAQLRLFRTDQGVPTFEEVLDLIDGQVPLLVELKVGADGDAAALSEATAKLLDGYEGHYVVQSFNPFALRWFKSNRPDVVRGILSADFYNYYDPDAEVQVTGASAFVLSNMLANVIARPNFISYEVTGYRQPTFALVHKVTGVDCLAWTIRTPDELTLARSEGAQGIVFDSFIPKE